MSAYTDHRFVAPVEGRTYRLTARLDWRIGHETGPRYTVPAGFAFDVSVPPGLSWLVDPHDARHFKAAALHDHMLLNGWSRITAAAEFHNALKADRVSAWRRLLMFAAVVIWRYR